MKKLLSLFLAILMMGTILGCSSTNGGTGDSSASPASSESSSEASVEDSSEPAEEAPAETPSGDAAEIHFWDMQWGASDTYDPAVSSLVEQFNAENSDIVVTYQIHAWDNYYQDYLTAITSGMAPDVSNGAFNQSIQYAVMDELIDLGSIVEEWKTSGFYDTFPAGSFELHQYNGVQVGIPWVQDPRLTTYNKEIFAEAGITEMPETWEEFRAVCQTIKDTIGITPWAVIAGTYDSSQVTMHMLFSAGVGMTDEEGNAAANSEGVIATLEFMGSMYDEGLLAEGSAGYTSADPENLFASEEIAIFTGGGFWMLANDAEWNEKMGVMEPFTREAGMEKRGLTWLNPMEAYKQSDYPEACKTFIKWWVENNTILFTEGGAHFSASAQINSDPFFAEDPYVSQVVEKVLPYSTTPVWPTPYLYEAFSQIDGEYYIGQALQEVLTGNRDYEAIANKYNDLIAAAIADFS